MRAVVEVRMMAVAAAFFWGSHVICRHTFCPSDLLEFAFGVVRAGRTSGEDACRRLVESPFRQPLPGGLLPPSGKVPDSWVARCGHGFPFISASPNSMRLTTSGPRKGDPEVPTAHEGRGSRG